MYFDFKEFLSAFIVLFAIIDVTGLIPVVIDLQEKSGPINAMKAATYSLVILVVFLFAGVTVLDLFGVDINSFAVAGGFVIFLLGIEMTLGIEIFRYTDGPKGSTTLVPVVFPLIAGAGTFTALLSLRAEYSILNIVLGLVANIIIVYLALRNVDKLEKLLGKGGIYVLRKFFGIILIAIAVKLVASNLCTLIQ
ncbi:MAG: MarC family protein [Bacteroidales bacterium]|nr:MarC family protein [Bacteroidales bacterium]